MISGSILINLLVQLVIGGLILAIIWWALAQFALPEPFAKIAKVLVVLFVVVWLINLLLTLGGHSLVRWN
jgi:uncharacterized membrane protein YwzB